MEDLLFVVIVAIAGVDHCESRHLSGRAWGIPA